MKTMHRCCVSLLLLLAILWTGCEAYYPPGYTDVLQEEVAAPSRPAAAPSPAPREPLIRPATISPTPPPSPLDTGIVSPYTGKPLPADALYCPYTGRRLPSKIVRALATATEPAPKTIARHLPAPDAPAPSRPVENHRLRPEPPAEPAKPGTLKIGSTPQALTIRFRDKLYEKTERTITIRDVPPGTYPVHFNHDGRTATKTVEIRPERETVVFGDLADGIPAARLVNGRVVVQEKPETGKDPARTFRSIAEADNAFRLAETLRTSANPFKKGERYREAEGLYRRILEQWPESDKVEDAYFRLGQIYESVYFRDHEEAVAHYKAVLAVNPKTRHPVRTRIARLYDRWLKRRTLAREWYERAAEEAIEPDLRRSAWEKAEALAAQGY